MSSSLSIVTVSTGSFIYFCDKDQAILPIITFVDSLSLADGPGAKYIHHSRSQEHSRSLTLIIFPRAKTKLLHWSSVEGLVTTWKLNVHHSRHAVLLQFHVTLLNFL